MVDQGRIVLKYIKSDNMDADSFSKPYDPTNHKKFAMKLLNTV
jgi:hypothetical protein